MRELKTNAGSDIETHTIRPISDTLGQANVEPTRFTNLIIKIEGESSCVQIQRHSQINTNVESQVAHTVIQILKAKGMSQQNRYIKFYNKILPLSNPKKMHSENVTRQTPKTAACEIKSQIEYSNNENSNLLETDFIICSVFPICAGGKGGYGANMKNEAANKKKFADCNFSKDLKGRRIIDKRNEIALKKYWKVAAREKAEIEGERRRHFEKLRIQRKEKLEMVVHQERVEFQKIDGVLGGVIRDAFAQNRRRKVKLRRADRMRKRNREMEKRGGRREGEGLANSKDLKRITKIKANIGIEEFKENKEIKGYVEIKDLKESKKIEQTTDNMEKRDNIIIASNKFEKSKADPIKNSLDLIIEKNPENLPKMDQIKMQEAKITTKICVSEKSSNPQIILTEITSLESLTKLCPVSLKNKLKEMGLKCGGTPLHRAQRLWEVSKDPSLMFSKKYRAKKRNK